MDWLSGQWILDRMGANGGEVVALRAAFVTLMFVVCSIGMQAWVDPDRIGPPTLIGLREQLMDLSSWIAAFFGAVYLALYSRFVSQWSYLANVYNQIKQAEAADGCKELVIAEWKAGFLEDAEHLHLVAKVSLAPIIASWSRNPQVKKAFIATTPAGAVRLKMIAAKARLVCIRIIRSHSTVKARR